MQRRRLEEAARTRREELRQLKRDTKKDLAVEEFKVVRDLIKMNIDIMERTEIYAVGAVAAVGAFALNAKTRDVALSAGITPFFIAVLGWIRYRALVDTINLHNDYIFRKIETNYPDALGLTSFYVEERNKEGKKILYFYKSKLYAARLWFWIILVSFSIALFALVYFHAPFGGGDELIIKRYPA